MMPITLKIPARGLSKTMTTHIQEMTHLYFQKRHVETFFGSDPDRLGLSIHDAIAM